MQYTVVCFTKNNATVYCSLKNPPAVTWGGEVTGYSVVTMVTGPGSLPSGRAENVSAVTGGPAAYMQWNTSLGVTDTLTARVRLHNQMGESPPSNPIEISPAGTTLPWP